MIIECGKLILSEEEQFEIEQDAYTMFRDYDRKRGGVRTQTITMWDSVDAFYPQAVYNFLKKNGVVNDGGASDG